MKRFFIISLASLMLMNCGGGNHSKNSINNSSQTSNSSIETSSASSAANNWNLVWSDEFDGDSLDTNKWSYVQDCLVAAELECYTNRPENVSVSDGKLHITARKETFTGPIWLDPGHTTTQNRTSGRITSLSGKWTYGRVEVKAKMPQGKGLGAAIWMFPASQDETHGPKYGDWPGSGEIDILEVFSPNTGGNSGDIHGTLVYGEALPGTRAATGKAYTPTTNIWDNYHVYAFEWEAGETRWYFDNIHYATQTKDGWFSLYGPQGEKQFSKQGEPFDQDFFLILNVAINSITDDANFPQEMAVDYVRVYSCGLDPVTGKGCATNVNKNIKPTTETPKISFPLFVDGTKNTTFIANEVSAIAKTVIKSDSGVTSNATLADGSHTLWDLQFNSDSQRAWLSWEFPSNITGLQPAFNLGSMAALGEISFDLFVDTIDDTTTLNVKLDSGGNNASHYSLKNVKVGEWQTISIPFVNLLTNENPAGSLRYGSVTSPFVIEAAGGKAHIKLNNINLHCIGANCEISPVITGKTLNTTFNVFVDNIDPIWTRGIQIYDDVTNSKHTQANIIDDSAEGRGKILDILWSDTANQNGLVYIESIEAKDATAFTVGGYISFDIKILSYGSNTTGLVYQVWCGYPCGDNGPVPPVPDDGQWHTITLPLGPFTDFGLNLKELNDPFVLHPTFDDQRGVHVQVDNIKWILP